MDYMSEVGLSDRPWNLNVDYNLHVPDILGIKVILRNCEVRIDWKIVYLRKENYNSWVIRDTINSLFFMEWHRGKGHNVDFELVYIIVELVQL